MCDNKEDIECVADFINRIIKIYKNDFKTEKHLFFRGHSDVDYKLQPSIFRDDYKEKEIFLDFKQYAPAHQINYDLINETEKLLVDMQHNEIPTRLLDWTVAPLNALFFCCSQKYEAGMSDGEIIIFDPWTYNKKVVDDYSKHPQIHQIHITARSLLSIDWKFKDIKDYIETRFEYSELKESEIEPPFAFVANFTNDRILHQRGVFTIHGEIKDPADEVFKGFLKRLTIKNRYKKNILDELNMLYVNDYSIYPDFVGMKKLIESRKGLFNL